VVLAALLGVAGGEHGYAAAGGIPGAVDVPRE
jgi:hypothetical protein